MQTGLSRPAELVHIAARATTRGASAVRFYVRHASEGNPNGIAASHVRSNGAAPNGGRPGGADLPDEVAAFIVGGIEVTAATWPSVVSPKDQTMVEVAEPDGLTGPEGQSWQGSAMLNPAFLYGNARTIEILVTFGNRSWQPSYRDTRMLTRIMCDLAGAAVDGAHGPIMSLHSPVSPFKEALGVSRGDGSGELIRAAEGPCLRMTVSVDPSAVTSSAERRLAFEQRVSAIAVEHGLGLRIADRRTHRISGEWFKVHDFRPEIYERRRDELFGWASDARPRTAFVVTVLGPDRVASILTVARALDASNIGIFAYASESLNEVSIGHLLIPVAPPRLSRVAGMSSSSDPLELGLRRLAKDCGLTPRSAASGAPVDFAPALGYQLLRSRATPLRIDTGRDANRCALWVAWDVPHPDVPDSTVVSHVVEALDGALSDGSLAHLRSHRTVSDRRQGRAKLAVRLPPPRSDTQLSRVCSEAQDRARHLLAAETGLLESQFRIRIVWREKWLGESGLGL